MRGSIGIVVAQHCEDAAHLSGIRAAQVVAPNVRLPHLARLDERLAAHLDGLLIAGDEGWRLCETEFESMSPGALFAATALVLETKHADRLQRLLALAQVTPDARSEVFAAFGWVSATRLQGTVIALLSATDPLQRWVSVAACGMHRVDPGLTSASLLEDVDPIVRARAWRTAGELGRLELVSTAAAAVTDEDPACAFWAAWSAVLLGDRHTALETLASLATVPGPFQERAFSLAMQAMTAAMAQDFMRSAARNPGDVRRLIRGASQVGDPKDIPWLIGLMANDSLARVAGESFSRVTGADLAQLDLERELPENFASGPDDDPAHSNIERDEDDGLGWPDPARAQAWWAANSSRFEPGVRYFMGEPLNAANCWRVLRVGYQRQRIAAALYLSLLNPGTPLFEWRAPARRQERLLAS